MCFPLYKVQWTYHLVDKIEQNSKVNLKVKDQEFGKNNKKERNKIVSAMWTIYKMI